MKKKSKVSVCNFLSGPACLAQLCLALSALPALPSINLARKFLVMGIEKEGKEAKSLDPVERNLCRIAGIALNKFTEKQENTKEENAIMQ